MFTPAINASSTSAPPCVIMVKAFCTQVRSPPFLNLLPLADAITTGLIDFEFMIVGDCAKNARGATATVKPATALERTKWRLFISDQTTPGGAMTISSSLREGLSPVGNAADWGQPGQRLTIDFLSRGATPQRYLCAYRSIPHLEERGE